MVIWFWFLALRFSLKDIAASRATCWSTSRWSRPWTSASSPARSCPTAITSCTTWSWWTASCSTARNEIAICSEDLPSLLSPIVWSRRQRLKQQQSQQPLQLLKKQNQLLPKKKPQFSMTTMMNKKNLKLFQIFNVLHMCRIIIASLLYYPF